MADETLGIDLLIGLPGVRADRGTQRALRLLDEAMARGDTCLDLDEALRHEPGIATDLAAWTGSLRASGLIGGGESGKPFVLDGNLLSGRRYWCYERHLAEDLAARAGDRSRLPRLAAPQVAEDLRKLFPDRSDRVQVDWQRLSAAMILTHGLTVVTGGPGTGKTTVAGRAIAIAARQAEREGRSLTVVIAAPTGKAAQRLRESLVATGRRLVAEGYLTEDRLHDLTSRVATLHRLLRDRHLGAADLVVIDEVSMADAATLSRALTRIPASTQVVLLGDPQQLASVDAGHVLGEIARLRDDAIHPDLRAACLSALGPDEPLPPGQDGHPLALCQVHLRTNWRSAASPAVTALAAAMQESPLRVRAVLGDPAYAEAAGAEAQGHPLWIARMETPSAGEVLKGILATVVSWAAAVVDAATPPAALALLEQRRVLCARRAGALGAEGLNQAIEAELNRRGLIRPWDDGNYHGRPLLMTRNDADLQLANGDIGVVEGRRGDARAWFPDGTGGLRPIPLHRLHRVEPVFAMSIHKSQGSQFDHVEIVTALDDSGSVADLLTRELLYTAVTRAAYSARIWADPGLLARALERRTIRRSGLGRFLRAGAVPPGPG